MNQTETVNKVSVNENAYENKILTIPNGLSFLRCIMAGIFAYLYMHADTLLDCYLAIGLLIVSELTDCIDGKIARKYHMISRLGKVLDPAADKVTEGLVAICLIKYFPLMKVLLAIFVVKEILQIIFGALAVRKNGKNNGAVLSGKICTGYLMVTFVILLVFPMLPVIAANVLIIIGCVLIVVAFINYMYIFAGILFRKEEKK